MKLCNFLGVISFLLVFTCFVKAQVQEGTPCETPTQQYGQCIPVKTCKVILDLLKSGITPDLKKLLRTFSCGYDGNLPLVCCPQQISRSPVTSPSEVGNADDTPSGEINESGRLLSPPYCGFSNVSYPRIVGGIPAKLGEFPWIVALGYRNSKNPNQPKWLCGGTLITERHVLTAGHCVYNRRDLLLARVGELDLYSDSDGANPVDIPIERAKIHENYNPSLYVNDVAILTLSRRISDIPSVWPVCLPWNDVLRSRDYLKYQPFVAGWGALYFNGPSSSTLQLTTLPVVNNAECENSYGNTTTIDQRIICAGYRNGGKDSCQGDSGGPLMYGQTEGKNLRFYLIGVVSYGFRCAEAGFPGVYSRVTHFLSWIEKNLE